MPSLIDKWSTYNLHIMLPVPDSIAIALWTINALRLSPIMRSLSPYIVPCPSFRAAQTRRSGRARLAYGARHAVPLRPPIAVTLVQYAHHLVPYQIIFNVPRALVLLDHIVDRRIDRCLVGDAHFKDLQRMPFSLRSFDELSFDSAVSGTSRMVATTE
ncbi:hypothetical protein [Mesorhizobium caraganae]|uniref:hypothetical protein n=1 Tax=Mesorhizobium caraganae TaxID=483206 RepID=UPI0028AEEEE1|nr:hypothetical protein [Mesorhizobium caraganae]